MIRLTGFHDGKDNVAKFAHDNGDGNGVRLTLRAFLVVERAKRGIGFNAGNRG